MKFMISFKNYKQVISVPGIEITQL